MAKLEVKVGIDNKNFKGGLDQMKADSARFKSDVSSNMTGALGPFSGMLNKLKGSFGGFFASLKGGFAGIAAALGVGGVATAVTNAVQYGDAIDDLSEKLGVSTRSVQLWKDAMEQNGASMEEWGSAMNKLELSKDKALSGNEDIIQSFAALGVSVEDLKSMSLDEIMLKIGSSSMAAGDMVAVMGKNAMDLKVALAAAADEGLNFNSVMEEKTVKALAKVNDAWTRFKNSVLTKVGEVLGSIIDAFSIITTGKPYVVADDKKDEEKRDRRKEAMAQREKEQEEKAANEKREEDEKQKAEQLKKNVSDQEGNVKSAEARKQGVLKAALSIPVDSLQAVGGGRGGFGGPGNEQIRIAQQSLDVERQMLAALQQLTGNTEKKESDAWQ